MASLNDSPNTVNVTINAAAINASASEYSETDCPLWTFNGRLLK
jgi:hypothetical protein